MVKRTSNILMRCTGNVCMVVLIALTILVSGCADEKEVYSLEEILSIEANAAGDDDGAKEENTKETEAGLPPTVWVHICGEVSTPGIYELPEGSRVYDVLVLAGGFTAEADTTHYNLAQVISDGMKLEIPGRREGSKGNTAVTNTHGGVDTTGITGTPTGGEPENALININTATTQQLQTLPGIGESRAADIVSYREKNGYFQSIEQIMEVSGIKETVFEKIKELITVDL